MMVTFISQCEKSALKKTRRVLDAFADRIGSNTWQTIITDEGLQAVKKLLRKTASKNTAVSCHWIRSRARTELLWVVGRRIAFNHSGLVPVNYTSKEVIMDKLPIQTRYLLANTNPQPLSQHLFAVGFIASYLMEKMGIEEPSLKRAAFIAGILHDIGKVDPEFQRWVGKKSGKLPEGYLPDDGLHIDAPKKFSFEEHPRHHELSWLLAESLLQGSQLNKQLLKQIAHGIYWHHTRPFRKDDKFINAEAIFGIFKKSLKDESFADIYAKTRAVLKDVAVLSEHFEQAESIPDFSKSFQLTESNLPDFKCYEDWPDDINNYQNRARENALNNLVRAAVISADRLVSSCSADDLAEYLEEKSLHQLVDNQTDDDSSLGSAIDACLQGFETNAPDVQRNKAQSTAAQQLAQLKQYAEINDEESIVGVLQGPAGCGKTKIALEWAKRTKAEKIIWICPRVQVCLGLLNDLTSQEYLHNSRIEIFTGEYKKILTQGATIADAPDTEEGDYFSGDIVLTTIDQAVNTVITHHKVNTLVDVMKAHVVFDEFHELVSMPAFNLLFAELIEAKKIQSKQANTLLVSATPHYFFVKEFLNINENDIISIDSFNTSQYRIEL